MIFNEVIEITSLILNALRFIGINHQNIVSIIVNSLFFTIFFFYFWTINKIEEHYDISINPKNGMAKVEKPNNSFFSFHDVSQAKYYVNPIQSKEFENCYGFSFYNGYDNGIVDLPTYNYREIYQSKVTVTPIRSREIDTICIDLGIISEFTPQDIEPDIRTLTSIYYTDTRKVTQIKEHGLSFFARFPEQQNKQAVRIFLVTAFLTLALQNIIKKSGAILQYIINERKKKSNNNKNKT